MNSTYPKKEVVVLHSVAVMESPQRGRPHGANKFVAAPVSRDAVMEEIRHAQLESPSPTFAQTSIKQKQKYRVLGTLGLTSIFYFTTCGGPVGSEPIVSAGGPLVGLIGVVVYALLCQVPLSMMLTELCCAFPENGGYAVWALTAFGPFWGFQVGYWSWVASVMHNAIYPGLIYTTVAQGFNVEATSGAVAFIIKAVIAIVLAIPSWIGVRIVGFGSIVLLVVVGLSTLLFTVWGFADGENAWFRLKEVRASNQTIDGGTHTGIDWELLIHSLFWCFDGLYDISVIGGSVRNPVRTYPRVIIAVVALSVLTYTVPWISAVASDKYSWTKFTEDSFPEIADAIGGSFLRQTVLAGSVLSMVAVFACTLFFQTYLVQGMAQSQILPTPLRKRSVRFKTPHYALLSSLAPTLAVLSFDHQSVMALSNALSAMAQLLIVCTMLELRRSFPQLARPVKMPGGMVSISVMLLPVVMLFVFMVVTSLNEWIHGVAVVILIVIGIVVPVIQRRLSSRGGCC